MKKLLTICLVLLLCTSVYATRIATATDTAVAAIQTDVDAMITYDTDVLALLGLGGTGNVFYVDSGATGSASGLDWTNAVLTLDAAVALCGNDEGDVILVAPGHAETLAGADGVDFDISGITVIGLGSGENRPVFTFSAAGSEVNVAVDDIALYNLNFLAGAADVAHAIEVVANAENLIVDNCRFYASTWGTHEFTDAIETADGADNMRITNCTFDQGAGAADTAISLVGADYALIEDNKFYGDYAVACVESLTTASAHITIKDNVMFNGTVGGTAGLNAVACISMKADTTGTIVNNDLFCNVATPALAIVGADMFIAGNSYVETEGVGSAGFSNIGKRNITSSTTSAMTIANGYDQDDDPAIFTVTGDILCRATATFSTQLTSTSSDTVNLGVVGNEAALLVQDVVDGTAFDVGDTWTLITAADADGAQMADEWLVVSGGSIKLYIDDHGLTAGVATFYLEWIGLSANANVVGVAP